MPKGTQFDDLARAAAQNIDAARAAGEQLSLLPGDPGQPVAEGQRPPRGKGKITSQLRDWCAAKGLRMPEDVLIEMAGMASTEDAILTALARTEQVLAWAQAGATGYKGAPVAPSMAQRLAAFQFVALYIMVLASFALTFYVAPDADQKWEWITPGSLAGAGIFLVSTVGFRVYVQNFANYNKTYGLLGGVMVLLFWFWISALVLLGAAQVNKLIEEASPLGKSTGERAGVELAPDFGAMQPDPNDPTHLG